MKRNFYAAMGIFALAAMLGAGSYAAGKGALVQAAGVMAPHFPSGSVLAEAVAESLGHRADHRSCG